LAADWPFAISLYGPSGDPQPALTRRSRGTLAKPRLAFESDAGTRGCWREKRTVAVAGPWRLATEWWTDAPCARDYYDLELSDGGLYRCYRERPSGAWFADGVYD
jgi:hypothetical protein